MRARIVSTLVLAASLVACTPTPTDDPAPTTTPASQFANWPTLLSAFRFHWTAAPGIDLTSGPAVLVRAYAESYDTATLTNNRSTVYPGFDRATPRENQKREGDYSLQYVGIRPAMGQAGALPEPHRQYGFYTKHLLELVSEPEGYRATVCTGYYSSFVKAQSRPGEYVSTASRETAAGVVPDPAGPFAGIDVMRIDFTPDDGRVPDTAPPSPPEPQQGPAPAPAQDVFGNWFVTGAATDLWGPAGHPEKIATPDIQRRCAEAMPHNETQRRQMVTGYQAQPPPQGSPEPGWPAQGN